MKREKEVPEGLLAYFERQKQEAERALNQLDIFCSFPVRAVKMSILTNNYEKEEFRMVIIPPVDVYTTNKAFLKQGYLKRDALSYFIAGTRKVFPYGHVYAESGYICLGTIFVPSAVPERSAAMPLETLFLHNDRNLSHGNSHLYIERREAYDIKDLVKQYGIKLSTLSNVVINNPGNDIIKHDEIWNLSADVAAQKSLPEALNIMSEIYKIVFRKDLEKAKAEAEEKAKAESIESEAQNE